MIIDFGKHEGLTHEQIWYNHPRYAQWMIEKRIHRNEFRFSPDEGEYFAELGRRARSLKGLCSEEGCENEMSSLVVVNWDTPGVYADFYCARCGDYPKSKGALAEMSLLSAAPWNLHGIHRAVERKYGVCPRDQLSLERFFHNDHNFSKATPGFFSEQLYRDAA